MVNLFLSNKMFIGWTISIVTFMRGKVLLYPPEQLQSVHASFKLISFDWLFVVMCNQSHSPMGGRIERDYRQVILAFRIRSGYCGGCLSVTVAYY